MLKKFYAFTFIFVLAIGTILAPVSNAAAKPKNVSNQEIRAWAAELEYIFENIAHKDEGRGLYIIDEQALAQSTFNQEEKQGVRAMIQYINNENSITIQSNAWQRCWQEAVGISGDILNEFLGYVEAKQWAAAAGVLAISGVIFSPIAIFVFGLTCGPAPAG
ncbi:hypothetical protein [Paenibacillus silvae]|uniref:TPM domain-containing protein n=1 Tax=Paenibacillus silvae TaxID=1325358 RepID=A0A2W6NXX6_9BACL|nr:hypothetical protein [Paenibacillus silvae]PZT52270.1 hypothetical protein DN757_28315 [Paenibacillus silvae]